MNETLKGLLMVLGMIGAMWILFLVATGGKRK
jgi:hypothetical protein